MYAPLILAIAAALLPIQLLLCFKARRLIVRLLPVLLLLLATVILAVMLFTADGWDAFGYLILIYISGGMLAVCGLGWGIWGLSKLIGR